MRRYVSSRAKLGLALGASSLASVGFWVVQAIGSHDAEYYYMAYNLALAWIPLGFALWLETMLRRRLWSDWRPLIVTFLWLIFLPNSFYVISDFVHLQEVPSADVVFDAAMFGLFALNGLVLGYLSLFTVHGELLKRLRVRNAGLLVALVLALSSFAIYIGRDLRWNTWDVLVNPAGLLFDVSDSLINGDNRLKALLTTLSFFVLISSVYLVIWYAARLLRQQKSSA